MKAISAQGDTEEEALIQYIIDGIPNAENNKIIYGAASIEQLKKKLEIYEIVKFKLNSSDYKDWKRRSVGGTRHNVT